MLLSPEIITANVISELAEKNIYSYGSTDLLKLESHMYRYFEREYEQWRGNSNPPESYGVSSFKGDIANIETYAESIDHYNNDFRIYQAFLDKEFLAYTMAYYEATDMSPEINNNITLSQAQINKFNLVIERAKLEDGLSVLELGCGFAGFSKYLLQKFPNIQITAVNPSSVQVTHIREVLFNTPAFDNNRFTLVQKYFDEITQEDLENSSFDRVISIGVLEAVTNLDKLFQLIARVLKPGGKSFHHFIVSVDTIPRFLNAENSLMADYFPGGHIWPYSEPKRHTTHLNFTESWYVNGMNYWKTLDEWHKRFWDSIGLIYPQYLTIDEVENWNKYFVLCKSMFKPNQGRSYGNGQYLYDKP